MEPIRQTVAAVGRRAPQLAAVGAAGVQRSYLHSSRPANSPAGPTSTQELILPYDRFVANLNEVRKNVDRPLSLAEKIVYSHLYDPKQEIVKGESYLKLRPDRVAMQDASAQMAMLQFMLAKLPSSVVPTSIHCDHLIEAYKGPKEDVAQAKLTNKEIFDFLQSTAQKYGISFWKPGSGIIHQIVLENYATPGALMLGTDSHTPNAGGLGMIAIGVGGADAVDAMAGVPWELKAPKILGVHLKGSLQGWASPKDVILSLVGKLTVQGGTGYIIEYFGEGVETLSCTGMATMCNMGAEMGATTSLFPFTDSMARYLTSTNRRNVADHAGKYRNELLSADAVDPSKIYDKIVEIDLSSLEPHINGPFTPDRSFPLSQFAKAIEENQWPKDLRVGLIGSCTNSSYEDMTRAASICRQAKARGLKTKAPLLLTPGSTQIQHTIARDGVQEDILSVGGELLANACGPCIGQWKRTDIKQGEDNAIVSSYNRNFARRNDGNAKTLNFLAAPEIVTAMAFAGSTTFNPATDTLTDANGQPFKFEFPRGEELPAKGFAAHSEDIFQAPEIKPDTPVIVKKDSTRLELLEPFSPWDGKDLADMSVLIKVSGKCTTDHISAAGPWLKYKGHLGNIAENTLIGAVNAENGQVNSVYNKFTQKYDTVPGVARDYLKRGHGWVVIGDENYGEGSAREHAAMQPRYLGATVIISRSFARIHETNLKKQGMLPLWLVNKDDYNLIHPHATVSTVGLGELAPGSKVSIKVANPDGKTHVLAVRHTMSTDQIAWFKAGSALNMIAQAQQ